MPSQPRSFRHAPPNFKPLDPQAPIEIHQRNLPHWRQQGATYFVTYRLSDSIPKDKADQLREYREEWLQQNPKPHTDEQLQEFGKLFATRMEDWLDQGAGSCLFKDSSYAEIVNSTLKHFDSQRYHLFCSVVMPNHIHAIVKPLGENSLEDIWQTWKKYSATNLSKHGATIKPIWSKEGYDRIIRDVGHLERVVRYIGNNPIKIGRTRDQTFCHICDDWVADNWDWMDAE